MSEKTLDVPQDEPFHQREWKIQRVGWVLWALIMIAALAGLLGTGPLSHAEVSAPDGSLMVKYDRYVHYHQPSVLEVLVPSRGQDGGSLRLKVSRSFLDRAQILRIEPEPEEQHVADDGIVYTFGQEGTPELGKILFHFEFEQFGVSNARVELVGGGSAIVKQFICP
jgi:hypothetical protein